jgi:hypothetical protein
MLSWVAVKAMPWRLIVSAALVLSLLGWHLSKVRDAVTKDRLEQSANALVEIRNKETKNLRRMEINATNAQADSSALVIANRTLNISRERLRDSIEDVINRPADAATECGNDAAFAGAVELFGRAESRASDLAKEAGRITGIARESQAYGQACYELTAKP